ncbi:hypothetical protein VaNZ11_003659 [Volvox africanus]|uniref:Chromatin assembly factor 1 subunit A dimerization domain-containing protein n=1 Tax=Volvox africanus TaxID=51714 RepID=A0ABQ5RUL8_9CHLO|nr:hypothetical protein VaNZ11_003659 [Volvox africanus]
MAGIMKFFKPTEGVGRKADQGSVGTAAREVFSPVCNTKGVQRAAIRPALDNDSDVDIVDGEASMGLKRKRKVSGHTTSGQHAPQIHCAGAVETSQTCQSSGLSGHHNDFFAAKPGVAVVADVQMAGLDQGLKASGPAAGTKALQQAMAAATTVAVPEFSPDLAARQPTAKRQRVPEVAPETSSADNNPLPMQQQEQQPHQQQTPTDDQGAKLYHWESQAAAPSDVMAHDNLASAPQKVAALQLQDAVRMLASGSSPQAASTVQLPLVEVLHEQMPAQLVHEQQRPLQQHHEHQDDTANAFQQEAQQSVADTSAVAMDADASASAAGGGGAVAAADTGGCVGAAVGAVCGGDGGVTGGAAAKSCGAGSSTLPSHLDLAVILESLRHELAGLEAALEVEMHLPESDSGLSAAVVASEGGRLKSMPTLAQLCVWLEGRTAPLSGLVAYLEPLLPVGADLAALRTSLVDLAQRKCYSAKEAPLEGAAASEDATPGRLWVWEVREPRKHLQGDSRDASTRKLAEAMRKRRKELRERLVAVVAAIEALSSHQALTQPPPLTTPGGPGPAVKGPSAAARRGSESRAAKAYNRLSRLADLEAVEAVYRSTTEALATAGEAAAASARKERARKEMEREKAREEKARQREEEAKAKEAKRAHDDDAKRRAREAAVANKAGYHSNKELEKSRNIMQSFFKRPLQSKPTGGGPTGQSGGDAAAAAESDGLAVATDAAGVSTGAATVSGTAPPTSTSSHLPLQDQAAPSGGGRSCSQPAGATPARERAATRMPFDFSKLARRVPDKTVVEALDDDATRLPLPAEVLAGDLRTNHARWRQQRAARKRMIGVPPTWARRPSAPTDLRTLAAQYYGDVAALGLAPEGLRTWRRKLIAFPRKETVRPPYYGSFSRTSTSVTGRRPFGRDSALDYEVASDEEWEEEPEGESLSDSGDEADSQAGGAAGEGGDDEDDGFIVGDDHLSDDEGAQLSGDPDDPMPVDGAAVKGAATRSAGVVTAARFMDPRLQQLDAAIDRVRTNNRPILLVRPMPAAAAVAPPSGPDVGTDAAPPLRLHCRLRAEPRTGLNTGLDPGLLGALRPVVHHRVGGDASTGLPVVALAPPLELDVYSAYAVAAAGGMAHSLAGAEDALHASTTSGGCEGLHPSAAQVGLLAANGLQAAAPGSARGLGSGARARSSNPCLAPATLSALAEFMSRCGDQKADRIVEGFLATLPPGVKAPAKTKLREAVKRLGAWSASSKRWLLYGGSVAAAVEHALAVGSVPAGAAAVAGPGLGSTAVQPCTPLATATAVTTGAAVAAAAAAAALAAGRGFSADVATTLTPTHGSSFLPGHYSLLAALVPGTIPGPESAPLLHKHQQPNLHGLPPGGLWGPPWPFPGDPGMPALRKIDGGGEAMDCDEPRPPPQQQQMLLLQQHQRLQDHFTQAPEVVVHVLSRPNLPGGGTAAAAFPTGLPASVGNNILSNTIADAPAAIVGTSAGVPLAEAPRVTLAAVGAGDAVVASDGLAVLAELPGGPSEERQHQPLFEPCGPQGSAGTQAVAAAHGQESGGDGSGGEGAYTGRCVTAAAETETEACRVLLMEVEVEARAPEEALQTDAGQHCHTLLRPMPPRPPPLSELALLGSGHPFWSVISSWVMGGGGPRGRSHRHRPSWADVSSALTVFEAGQLEPRLQAVPLDLVRVLVAVCQHSMASHLRSGAFKALGNLAAALAAAARAGGSAGMAATSGGPPGRGRGIGDISETPEAPAGSYSCGGSSSSGPEASSMVGPVRPTGQPCRCSPQPVTLQALWSLPGLLEVLRRGCCDSDPDSETDKAARSAARVLAALVGVGITVPSASGREAQEPEQAAGWQQQLHQQGEGGGGAEQLEVWAVRQRLHALAPEMAASAAAFRLRVVNNGDLHAALRNTVAHGPGKSPSSARNVFHAHMLLALQRLLRDPAAAAQLLKPHVRLAKEAAAAAKGRVPPPPVSPDLESKWAAKLMQNLVTGGRGMVHPGCRKGMVQCAAALMDLPALTVVIPATSWRSNKAQVDEGGGNIATAAARDPRGGNPDGKVGLGDGGSATLRGWSSLLSGNDPRTHLPTAVLTLLVSELRQVSEAVAAKSCADVGKGQDEGSKLVPERQIWRMGTGPLNVNANDSGFGVGAPREDFPHLDKCTRGRVVSAMQLAVRALRHLGRPSSRMQLRQEDTKAAVADVLMALQEAGEVLGAHYDPQLQELYGRVGSLAEDLS